MIKKDDFENIKYITNYVFYLMITEDLLDYAIFNKK